MCYLFFPFPMNIYFKHTGSFLAISGQIAGGGLIFDLLILRLKYCGYHQNSQQKSNYPINLKIISIISMHFHYI